MAKKGIHPKWHNEAKVMCNGEEVLTTSGTQGSYTGAACRSARAPASLLRLAPPPAASRSIWQRQSARGCGAHARGRRRSGTACTGALAGWLAGGGADGLWLAGPALRAVDIWSGNHPFFQGATSTVVTDEGRVNRCVSGGSWSPWSPLLARAASGPLPLLLSRAACACPALGACLWLSHVALRSRRAHPCPRRFKRRFAGLDSLAAIETISGQKAAAVAAAAAAKK